MLRSVGEDDVTESRMALPILLAIGWGSGIGGFGSPIGSSANLVAVSYIEKLTGHEFMYYDWVIRFLPLLAIVFFLNLIFLWLIPAPAKDLPGTRAYFREMYSKFGTMRRGEKIGLYLFILATGITGVMGVNPIPYILGTIVAANCAYILPVSTRAIPVGYGLNPSLQIKYGIRLSILTCATTIIICTLFMNYSPLFNEL